MAFKIDIAENARAPKHNTRGERPDALTQRKGEVAGAEGRLREARYGNTGTTSMSECILCCLDP